jgi:insecticidal toxin complex protein TccC
MAYETLATAFRDGDIIYGLDGPRNQAIQAVISAGFHRQITYRKTILGCFPGATVTQVVVMIQNDITNAVWDPQSPNRYASDKAIGKTLEDGGRGHGFKTFLANHPSYNVAQNNRVAVDPVNGPVEAWRRTSKGGLEYQVRVRGDKVHFVVDLIIDTLTMVASKQKHGLSITSAELRWLFRHRGLPEVQRNVRFWLADREVTHDELFARAEWDEYHPTHVYDSSWH